MRIVGLFFKFQAARSLRRQVFLHLKVRQEIQSVQKMPL